MRPVKGFVGVLADPARPGQYLAAQGYGDRPGCALAGPFDTAEAAAHAYDDRRRELGHWPGRLNFPANPGEADRRRKPASPGPARWRSARVRELEVGLLGDTPEEREEIQARIAVARGLKVPPMPSWRPPGVKGPRFGRKGVMEERN